MKISVKFIVWLEIEFLSIIHNPQNMNFAFCSKIYLTYKMMFTISLIGEKSMLTSNTNFLI